jgi:hypothetical protein
LLLFTDRAVSARISNDRTFPADRTLNIPLTQTATVTGPDGFQVYEAEWDLLFGLKEVPAQGNRI